VACRNEARTIRSFLDSVLQQDYPGDWEIVIADGASTDGSRNMIAEYQKKHPRIRLIDNPGRTTPQGLNLAIRASRGDMIARMDAHTEYAPDYLRRCVEVASETGCENVGGPARVRGDSYLSRAICAAYVSPFSCGGARFHDPGYEGFVDTVPYGCWRRSTLQALGLFDERFVRNQDDELNLRLTRSGGKIWQSGKIVSWYQPRKRLRELFKQYFQYGFWKVAVIRKHKLPASWRHLAPGTFMLFNAGLLAGLILSALTGSAEASKAIVTIWWASAGAYFGACLLASAAAGIKHGLALVPVLPLVFCTYHAAYGTGFLAGLAYWSRDHRLQRAPGLFTEVTRS
jgi:glycosyltransferase involved in cell wall biosynthesis